LVLCMRQEETRTSAGKCLKKPKMNQVGNL
jgi:hypothetical protein